MEIHKKILLILTIIIATIILYRLWSKRQKLENEPIIEPVKESFKPHTLSLYNYVIRTDSSLNTISTNQYFIKASWNTAYSGKYNMDLSMVVQVLNRGCRFIDFEIYSVTDSTSSSNLENQPVVGFSSDAGSNYQTSSKNTLPLYDVLLTAITTSNSLTVKNDPLYIQLRIKSGIIGLYENVMAVLIRIFGINNNSGMYDNLLYKNVNKKISPNTISAMQLPLEKNVFLIADLVNSDPMFERLINPNINHSLDNTINANVQLIEKYQTLFANYTVPDFSIPGIASMSTGTNLKSCIRPPVIVKTNVIEGLEGITPTSTSTSTSSSTQYRGVSGHIASVRKRIEDDIKKKADEASAKKIAEATAAATAAAAAAAAKKIADDTAAAESAAAAVVTAATATANRIKDAADTAAALAEAKRPIVTVKYYNCLTCANNVNQFTESFPDLSIYNNENPSKADILSLVMNYGVNILPARFYIDDQGLEDYESIFGGFGFITMAEILTKPDYIKQNNETNTKK